MPLAVQCLDARQTNQVVATTDDVVLKTNMANQISAVMDHFYQMIFPCTSDAADDARGVARSGHITIPAATTNDARGKARHIR